MKLDAKSVAALDLGGKTDVIYFDDAMPGFGYRLRGGAGGRVLRSWVVQYRRGGATRRYHLGSAEVIAADAARAAAKKVQARVTMGEDPQAAKGVRRTADKLSFRAIANEYIIHKTTGKEPLRPRTAVELKRYLLGSYFKPLHTMPIDKISQADVATRLVTITNKSGAAAAAHARSDVISMFKWAMQSGIVAINVAAATPQPKQGEARERVLVENKDKRKPDELGPIWRACADDDYGKVIKLLILTGCRRAEIGGMCWSEIDLERGMWTLPKQRSKNGREHTLPLSPMAQAIIESVPRMAHRDQLFGVRAGGFTAWTVGKLALDARCGVSGWTVHDIRRSVATGMSDIGIQPHIVETVLNHQSGFKSGVAGTYNKSSYGNEVRDALLRWADHVRALVDGGERKVVNMPVAAS